MRDKIQKDSTVEQKLTTDAGPDKANSKYRAGKIKYTEKK